MELNLTEKLERIFECATPGPCSEVERNLLHAYIACLTFDELCDAIPRTIDAHAPLRLALRRRLLRFLRLSNSDKAERLALLVQQVRSFDAKAKALRARVDALLSAIYNWLPIDARYDVLEQWVDRGTTGAARRWLKAVDSDAALFDPSAVLSYWRKSNDYLAAKTLAYRADTVFLDTILLELAANCKEGWIVSKAALQASAISAEVWDVIRDKQPASYAYLCAMTDRKISEEEALVLIDEASVGSIGDGPGLVIWAIGQMGMITVLDSVRMHRVDAT